jgi:hypothetical protein
VKSAIFLVLSKAIYRILSTGDGPSGVLQNNDGGPLFHVDADQLFVADAHWQIASSSTVTFTSHLQVLFRPGRWHIYHFNFYLSMIWFPIEASGNLY